MASRALSTICSCAPGSPSGWRQIAPVYDFDDNWRHEIVVDGAIEVTRIVLLAGIEQRVRRVLALSGRAHRMWQFPGSSGGRAACQLYRRLPPTPPLSATAAICSSALVKSAAINAAISSRR